MNFTRLPLSIDLNDPEGGFNFTLDNDCLTLSFTDWRNRRVTFRFRSVYRFEYFYSEAYCGLPEGDALEIMESEVIESLRTSNTAGPEEELHHFVISTNLGEWCEIIAETIEVKNGRRFWHRFQRGVLK
jgi:hypothetical protein